MLITEKGYSSTSDFIDFGRVTSLGPKDEAVKIKKISVDHLYGIALSHPGLVALKDKSNSSARAFEGPNQQISVSLISPHSQFRPAWFHYGVRPVHDAVLPNAVEESTYRLDPDHEISHYFHDDKKHLSRFVMNPYEALPHKRLQTPETQKRLIDWAASWNELNELHFPLFPGQYSNVKIPGLRKHILNQSLDILKQLGVDYLAAVPTWFHTSQLYQHGLGFEFVDQNDAAQIDTLQQHVRNLTKEQQSWVVMLQYWAETAEKAGLSPQNYIHDSYIIRDGNGQIVTYPLNNSHTIWMKKAV